jgi:hypothetical protein
MRVRRRRILVAGKRWKDCNDKYSEQAEEEASYAPPAR